MSDDPRCDTIYQICPAEASTEEVGQQYNYTHTINSARTINMVIGGATIALQSRLRDFSFTIRQESRSDGCKRIVSDPTILCGCVGSSYDTPVFTEKHDTHDAELLYLDLRNDTAVTKEIDNAVDTSTLENSAQTATVDVFTGYESVTVYPFVFAEGIPITENIKYKLYTGSVVAELHTEDVARAYPFSYLLMPTYPESNFGTAVIVTAWAAEIEWYRQDTREPEDGDPYLFWAEWLQGMGRISQALDTFNRDLLYAFRLTGEPISGKDQAPKSAADKTFYGSVAYDRDKNMFYSIAVPTEEYAVEPEYALNQELVVDDVSVPIPTEKIMVKQIDDSYLEQDSEHTAWFPIAPL